jgi:hypothetical protein
MRLLAVNREYWGASSTPRYSISKTLQRCREAGRPRIKSRETIKQHRNDQVL